LSFNQYGKYRLVRSCAATFSKGKDARGEDTLRGFNLIKLNRNNNIVTSMHAHSFNWLGTGIIQPEELSKDRSDDGMFK
jgi:hypothetical protein